MSCLIHLKTYELSCHIGRTSVTGEEPAIDHSPSITLATLCPHVPQNPLRTTSLPAASAKKSQMVTGGGQSGHQTLSRISLFLSAGRAIQRVNVLLVDACAMKRSFIMILIILSLPKTFPQLAVPVFNVVFIGPPVSQEFHALINIEPVRRDTPNSHLAGFSILWLPSNCISLARSQPILQVARSRSSPAWNLRWMNTL